MNKEAYYLGFFFSFFWCGFGGVFNIRFRVSLNSFSWGALSLPVIRKFIFADEGGDFTFSRAQGASRYFTLCSVELDACRIAHDLLELRRQLVWEGLPVGDFFHATTDKQVVRDRVFALIAQEDFLIDATILEKTKAQPHTKTSKTVFYQYAWYYHFKYVAPILCRRATELLICPASVGTRREQAAFTLAVNNCMQQTVTTTPWKTSFPPSQADPCLQLADYCCWAIHRKWERGNTLSYNLIQNKIRSEFDLWARGQTHYY